MAKNAIDSLQNKNLKSALKNLKYVSILVLVVGMLSTFFFYTGWPDAVIQDEVVYSTNNEETGEGAQIGCIKNILNFYGSGACEEYVQIEEGGSDRVDNRIAPIEWTPGIGFFIVLLGSLVTGGGTLYILGNVDRRNWKAVIKKQELIERQEEIQKGEIDKNKELLKEFDETEERLKQAEKSIEDAKAATKNIDYQGIEDLENELDRLTALNQSVNTLNSSLESKLKTARLATSDVEKRSRMAEKELNEDLAAKTNLEKEIENLRDKHENDMRLSDRMTREIGSLRQMAEEADERARKAEKQLKVEKPDTVRALESYDSVKAAHDKTVDEKNNLEKEIMDLEQQTLDANEREKAALAERKDAAQRRKELDREVKLMEKNKKRLNDKFTTLTSNLEKAKKDLASAREKAAVTLSELDLERETIVELQQDVEKHRQKEGEIVGFTDSLKELQEQVKEQNDSNQTIFDDLKEETDRKRKTEKDLETLEKASKQVSKVMESLKKQFDAAKDELNIASDERNKAERLLETEKDEHEKLKEDLEFLQNNTIGSEEDTERKIKAMEIESSKSSEQANEMQEEADNLIESNDELREKIKGARIDSIDSATEEAKSSEGSAKIGSSLIVKNLTKETEHNFELVNPDQADIPNGKIPLTNPIGKSLEGAKEGDEVKVGPTTFKVLKLEN
ncbi:MAG: GreA/GreB family elongation factor [Candidatus Poseidoniales archaeon]